jgi:hypothetical protein
MPHKTRWDSERFWKRQLVAAWGRRREPGYRKWAKRCAKQLRKVRADLAWMRGDVPLRGFGDC